MGITESKLRAQDEAPLKFKDASPTEGGISHASPLAGRNACSTSKESSATTHRRTTTAGARISAPSGPGFAGGVARALVRPQERVDRDAHAPAAGIDVAAAVRHLMPLLN